MFKLTAIILSTCAVLALSAPAFPDDLESYTVPAMPEIPPEWNPTAGPEELSPVDREKVKEEVVKGLEHLSSLVEDIQEAAHKTVQEDMNSVRETAEAIKDAGKQVFDAGKKMVKTQLDFALTGPKFFQNLFKGKNNQ